MPLIFEGLDVELAEVTQHGTITLIEAPGFSGWAKATDGGDCRVRFVKNAIETASRLADGEIAF